MTTRDPRSRAPQRPPTGREAAREVTASMSIELPSEVRQQQQQADEESASHPSLAVGTSDVARSDRTKIESPAGRNKTPVPKAPPTTKPPPRPTTSSDDADQRLGTVVGAYKIHELLGKGGMGYVFRAEHVKLGREVALKLLRGDYAKRRDAVLRFFQEAKTVNRVRHRNIVDVTDFVELDDGTTFIIMEFLRGQSLGKWARTGVDLPRALAVLVQICDGLGAAHAVGVVHRDLKPDNVMVLPTSDGAELVKLLDFGVAKLVNRDDEDVGFQTAAGSVIGTPAYMSPEQAGGMAVDHRSDIYSLGAIMYELFCGVPMFRGRSFGEYVRKHLTENPVPPRQTAGGANLDERIEALILKCLAKDPNTRFSHILELRDGLLHMLAGIDTHPPGSHSVSNSLVRAGYGPHSGPLPVPSAPLIPSLPMPPAVTANPGSHPSQPSLHTYVSGVASGVHHPSATHNSYASGAAGYQSTHVEPTTPWWIWAIGGTVAVALGIGGALWFAQGSKSARDPAPAQATQPTTAPIEQAGDGASVPGPKMVELRFDSLPSAGVYADGRSAELCRTPCNFNVDLGDGGPTDKRVFVVRADGYEDKRVAVDFAVSERDFSVSLLRMAGAVPIPTEPVDVVEPTDATEPRTTKKSSRKKRSDKGEKAAKTDGKKATEDKPTTIEEKPVEPVPVEPTPEVPKPKTPPRNKIDPSDTIDPFSNKK